MRYLLAITNQYIMVHIMYKIIILKNSEFKISIIKNQSNLFFITNFLTKGK